MPKIPRMITKIPRRINLSALPKKERHKIKSSRPRRRIAKEAARRTRAEVSIPEKGIRARIKEIYPDLAKGYFSKLDHRTLGLGLGRIVLVLGSFKDPKTKARIRLIVKTYKLPNVMVNLHKLAITKNVKSPIPELLRYGKSLEFFDGNIFLKGGRFGFLENEERIIRRMASLGIPTVRFAKAIRLGENMDCIVVEDLSKGNRFKVMEFQGFDSTQIRNWQSLQKQFGRHYSTLIKAGIKMSRLGSHGKNATLGGEIEKCFFVVVDPKTKIGRLVVGDADHIEF